MASKLASGDLIADRYASALYDLAADSKSVDPVLADNNTTSGKFCFLILSLSLLVGFYFNEDASGGGTSADFYDTWDHVLALKENILEKLLLNIKANKLTLTFLKVLEQNKRFSNLYSIISQFININAYNRGDVLADITSAEELNDEQRKNIKEQLKNTLGKKLSLKFIVDKKVIGGLVVKVGSKMIDTSLANKINKLKIAMKGA